MSIGENVKKIRTERGIPQSKLAESVGITQSMLCQIERGTKALSLALAKDIADYLKCSVSDFYI